MPRNDDHVSTEFLVPVKNHKTEKIKLLVVIIATIVNALLVAGMVILLFTFRGQTPSKNYLHYYPPKNAQLGIYQRAAVATDHQICSDIGRDILLQNGSAVDAAIAAVMCVGVMNPAGSGIGGGSFALIYNKNDHKIYALDSREEAPLASNSTMYVNRTDASLIGNLAIGIPGEIAGYYTLWKRFGRLPWSKLFEPSINLCMNGMPVSKPLTESIASVEGVIRRFKNLSKLLVNATTNETIHEGETRRDELLGSTLRRIADNPFDFYNGSLADEIVADACEDTGTHSCILTKADLSGYTPRWRTPISMPLKSGKTIYMLPPPSSAAVLGLYLNGFEKYGVSVSDFDSFDSTARFYQRQTELAKFAFAERVLLGDEDFNNFSQVLKRVLSKSYAEHIVSMINDTATNSNSSYYMPPQTPASYTKDDSGTSHVSVIDAEGNAVTTTSTVNTRFGSMIRGSKTGIIFNNEMDDFSTPGVSNGYNLPPGEFNFPEPRKRPLSSMSPLLLIDQNGDVAMLTGASGGPRILSGTVATLLRVLFLNDDLKLATDAPRLHHQYLPNVLFFEPDFPAEFREKLRTFGHSLQLNLNVGGVGIVQSIRIRPDKKIEAYSDARKYSGTAGY